MPTTAAWVPLDPEFVAALQMAVLVILLASLAGPWYWLLQDDDDDYDPSNGMGDVPLDDPMRSPDWCHAHGGSNCKEK